MKMATGPVDKKSNILPSWGNEKTMNLNNMILTNILSSHYFKVNLYQLKTFHEVVDEIYYNVSHLEPWEKGSRKTSGQTGMCGGVRGVGAGGIVSTAFCILYKLFTLKLTRKQVLSLITHCDSPYIRGLGFMYIRYTQPPADLWDWFEVYLTDEEEIDVKAGGGQVMTIGEMLRHFLSKLEWHSTLFPRTPVPIQKDIERRLSAFMPPPKTTVAQNATLEGDETEVAAQEEGAECNQEENWAEAQEKPTQEDTTRALREEASNNGRWSRERQDLAEEILKERERQQVKRSSPHSSSGTTVKSRHRSKERDRNSGRDRDRNVDREREKERAHDRDRTHDRDRNQEREKDKNRNYEREKNKDLEREKDRDKDKNRSRDHNRYDRHHTSSSGSKPKAASRHRSHSRDRSKHRRH